jgi:hypothetical protein
MSETLGVTTLPRTTTLPHATSEPYVSPLRREESAEQRADRNFHELLQELRVAQTGVQILFAFLLIFPLQPRFTQLDAGQRAGYLAALGLCATAACLLIAPAAYHRMIFRRGLKEQLVQVADRFARAGLICLLASMAAGLDLVVSIVAGPFAGASAAAGLSVLAGASWFAAPIVHRRNFPRL